MLIILFVFEVFCNLILSFASYDYLCNKVYLTSMTNFHILPYHEAIFYLN